MVKRRKLKHAAASRSGSTTPLDRATWPGWCEIESEPAFFSVMLSEMGVQGVKVQEVLGLDDELLAILPKPVYGVIFLFRYREADTNKQDSTNLDHVWFANQVPNFACATVALLNIVNNVPDIEIGPHLQSFKDFTKDFEPMARGHAIESFDFVRRIHNSFARDVDMLNVDMSLKQKHDRTAARRRADAAKATRAAKKATQVKSAGVRRSERTPKQRNLDDASHVEEGTDEDGYHFIAYVPIANEVWKLDGLDIFPQNLGPPSRGDDWLAVVKPVLQDRMAQYEQGQIEFSLMAVVQDPVIELRTRLAGNIAVLRAIENALGRVQADWRSFLPHDTNGVGVVPEPLLGPSTELGISETDIPNANIPDIIIERSREGNSEKLVGLWKTYVASQAEYRTAIRDEMRSREANADKARLRRHDFRPFFQAWLDALKEQDVYDVLVAKVQAKD